MDVAGEEFIGGAWNEHATREFEVVPFKVHTGKFCTLAFLSDGIVLLEDVAEVKGVVFADVFNSKVINNEGE